MNDVDLNWSDERSPAILASLLANFDYGNAGKLLENLVKGLDATGRLIESGAAKRTVSLLKNYAWFEKLREVAEKFNQHAQNDPKILLQIALARIELGEITEAIDVLQDLRIRLEEDIRQKQNDPISRKQFENDLSESLGLLGRSYKQLYINAQPVEKEPRSYDLEQALGFYQEAFHRGLGDYCWHGVNIIALKTHRERVRVNRFNAISQETEATAKKIISFTENIEKTQRYHWHWANLIESHLALGQTDMAIKYVEPYLKVADPFAIQSTRRQLIEIWMLDESRPPGNHMLPMMNARFAEMGGGGRARIVLDPSQATNYEKVWGDTGYKSLQWLIKALERAKSVARIGPNKYEGQGTGFLFDGAWIGPAWAGRNLLLTNAHVCSNDPEVMKQYPYPSPPEELTATFLGTNKAEDAEEIPIAELIWTSSPSEFDATLLLLVRVPDGCTPPPVTRRRPPVTVHGDARLNILGHPKGLDLRISLQDNEIIGIEDCFVHYRTPTDPGSSGSPVFNQKWDLVALHHASSNAKKANEGVRIDVIVEAIKKSLIN